MFLKKSNSNNKINKILPYYAINAICLMSVIFGFSFGYFLLSGSIQSLFIAFGSFGMILVIYVSLRDYENHLKALIFKK